MRWMLALVASWLPLAACSAAVPAREAAAPAAPPNLVFLLTDDQRWDALGYAGNPIIHTPNLDALARDGVYFRNAFVTTPICSISRASLLSGQYARRHGIHDFATPFSDSAFAHTYPALLRGAGYRTGYVGKYGVGNPEPVERFDYWRSIPQGGPYEMKDSLGRPVHRTQLTTDLAIAFLESQPRDRPFVLSVGYKAPHAQDNDPRQFIYDPRDSALYAGVPIPPPPTAAPRYWEAHPEFFRRNNEGRTRWGWRFATPESYQTMVQGYYRLISAVDRSVGDIRAALRRLGLEENTVIVFMSDNGFFLGEHGLADKWYGYEPSVRVPLILHDPRLPASLRGQREQAMALNVDIAPTLLELAGVPVPERMQGSSLLPLVRDRATSLRSDFYFEHPFEYQGRIPRSEGVIGGRYKYLRYLDPDPDHEVVFDLEADPLETTNLAPDPRYREVLERLRARYRELQRLAS